MKILASLRRVARNIGTLFLLGFKADPARAAGLIFAELLASCSLLTSTFMIKYVVRGPRPAGWKVR